MWFSRLFSRLFGRLRQFEPLALLYDDDEEGQGSCFSREEEDQAWLSATPEVVLVRTVRTVKKRTYSGWGS